MSEESSRPRSFSLARGAIRVAAGGALLLALCRPTGASAAWRSSETMPTEPTASVLGYEGVLGQERTEDGIRTQLTECTASVINLPGTGPRIVTARHCDGAGVRIFDDKLEVRPTVRREIEEDGPDVTTFETPHAATWSALSTRPSTTLREGEKLCAFHVTGGMGQLRREEVCGVFVGRTVRLDGGPSQLVVSHPFVHGTSGSPLFDVDGRVVGIVSATSEREGFAEPIEQAIVASHGSSVAPRTAASPRRHGSWPFASDEPRVGSVCVLSMCVRWQVGA